jgi:GH15 family glucan-1,4-alpha-glucosidase
MTGHYQPIENYGVIGNLRTAALVGMDGSIDWLCVPRFDSGACFAALLGTDEHGAQSTVIDFETFFGTSGWTPWPTTPRSSRYAALSSLMRRARRWRTTVAE